MTGGSPALHILLSSFDDRVSPSLSLPPTTAASTPAPEAPVVSGPLGFTKQELISALDIDAFLCKKEGERKGDVPIQVAYSRYKAILAAECKWMALVAAKEWSYPRVNTSHIVGLFLSKSMWHKYHQKIFPLVGKHPLMMKWLDGDKRSTIAIKVWGEEKKNASFGELIAWLDTQKSQEGNEEGDQEEEKKEEKKKKKKDRKGKGKEKSR
ncbi:hypothetical protein BD779DRAFT_1719225 [Infundibulicybe gibba]|nr:hypothetical protein BD779DRAFT_1719225 [Infundibulicybe gibba]